MKMFMLKYCNEYIRYFYRANNKKLSEEGVALNITAIMTSNQVSEVMSNLSIKTPSIISVLQENSRYWNPSIPEMKEC